MPYNNQFIVSFRDIFGSHKKNLDNLSSNEDDISGEGKRSKEKWKNTSKVSDSYEETDKTEESDDIEKNEEDTENSKNIYSREAVNLI